ncbi:MAG: 16S rRNA (cytidine(1402)-2'-O)-methyltransferase [Bacteroidota bacterium]
MSRLYVVPTPIGNLEDITYRAVRILKEVDFILAEDTRTSGFLLKHYDIKNKMVSHHLFNEHRTLQDVVVRIANGEKAALISDAGTPCISDPGFLLVRACVQANIPVECLPGPTAFVPALVNSGLPNERFIFEGFLPQKKGRQTKLESLKQHNCTFILYESPHRLLKALGELSTALGPDRLVSVSRELSKIHEENTRGTLQELIKHYENRSIKGEVVIVVSGNK